MGLRFARKTVALAHFPLQGKLYWMALAIAQ